MRSVIVCLLCFSISFSFGLPSIFAFDNLSSRYSPASIMQQGNVGFQKVTIAKDQIDLLNEKQTDSKPQLGKGFTFEFVSPAFIEMAVSQISEVISESHKQLMEQAEQIKDPNERLALMAEIQAETASARTELQTISQQMRRNLNCLNAVYRQQMRKAWLQYTRSKDPQVKQKASELFNRLRSEYRRSVSVLQSEFGRVTKNILQRFMQKTDAIQKRITVCRQRESLKANAQSPGGPAAKLGEKRKLP